MAGRILVLPAASSPSISSRISLDPKILFIIFEMEPPMAPVVYGAPVDAMEGLRSVRFVFASLNVRCSRLNLLLLSP